MSHLTASPTSVHFAGAVKCYAAHASTPHGEQRAERSAIWVGGRFVPRPPYVGGAIPHGHCILEVLDIDRPDDVNAVAMTRDHHGRCHQVQCSWLAAWWMPAPDCRSPAAVVWLLDHGRQQQQQGDAR